MADGRELKVVVDFPFRGRFYWDAERETVLEADPSFQQWDESLRSVVSQYLGMSELSHKIVNSADEVWEILGGSISLSSGGELYLTEEQMLILLDALMLPGSRGEQGEVSWEDNPQGFVVDPNLSAEYVFSFGTPNEKIIASIYDETQRDTFSMVVGGQRHLVLEADKIADDVYFKDRDEWFPVAEKKEHVPVEPVSQAPVPVKIVRVVPEEQKVTVRVFFPYRALFRWDDDAARRMGVPDWKPGMYNALKIALNKSPHFRKKRVVPDYVTLRALLNEFRFYSDEEYKEYKGYKLTEQQKNLVVEALTVPGSRGAYGNIAYESAGSTRFIVDPYFTREFTLDYRADGNYIPVLLQFVGNVPFQYEIVG